jgi:hypothetical protein
MIQFVPLSTQAPEWGPSALIERPSQLQGEEENLDDIDAVRDNCYILMSIVLGAIYRFRSKFCMDDGHEMSEDSEIAFLPDSIYSGQLKHWARMVGSSLTNTLPVSNWTGLIFGLFLRKRNQTTSESSANYINRQNPFEKRLFLGAQG